MLSERSKVVVSVLTFGGNTGEVALLDSTGTEVDRANTCGGLGGLTLTLDAGDYSLLMSLISARLGTYDLTVEVTPLLRVI